MPPDGLPTMRASYNVYSIVLVVGIVQCVVVALALALRAARGGRWADGWLAGVLTTIALVNAPYLLGFMGLYDRVAWLSNLPISNPFLVGPVVLGYVLALTGARRWSWGPVLFAPAVVALVLGLWVWTQTTSGTPFGETVGPTLSAVFGPLGLAFNAACVGGAAWVAWTHRRRTATGTTETDRIVRRWLPRFLTAVGMAVTVAIGFAVAYALGVAFSYETQWWAHAVYTVLGYYGATAGYGVARQLDAARADVPDTPERSTPPLDSDEVAAWRSRLDAWMRTRRPHLRPDLTLAALAEEVGLAPAALSHAVNAGFGTHFNDFVNGYRVAEVQARLAEPDAEHLTLLAVATECGFNSKSTFNRAFRKATGTTPSAWWAAHRAEEGRRSRSGTSQAAI